MKFCPVGIELTFFYPDSRSNYSLKYEVNEEFAALVKDLLYCYDDDPGSLTPITECDIMEMSTKVMHSIDEVKGIYSKIESIANNFGLSKHSETDVSGGGHITVGPISRELAKKIAIDHIHRPYLNWAFNDSSDEENSKGVLFSGRNFIELVDSIDDPIFDGDYFFNQKDFAINIRDGEFGSCWEDDRVLVEFRYFDSALNLEDQLFHVEFVQKYLKYVEKIPLSKIQKEAETAYGEISKYYNKNFVIQEFRDFMKNIGLGAKKKLIVEKISRINERFQLNTLV